MSQNHHNFAHPRLLTAKVLLALALVVVAAVAQRIGVETPACNGVKFQRGITKPLLATEIASNFDELIKAVSKCNENRTPKEALEGTDAGKQFIAATTTDYFFIGSYGTALFIAVMLFIDALRQRRSLALIYLSLFCVIGTSVADVFENRGLIHALTETMSYSPAASLLKWSLLFATFLFWGLALLIDPVFGDGLSNLFAFSAIPSSVVGLLGVRYSSGVLQTGTSMLVVPLLLVLIGLFAIRSDPQRASLNPPVRT